MTQITDAVAISFSDHYVRRIADLRVQEYRSAKQFLAEWGVFGMNARVTGHDADILADSAGTGQDPSRPVITGADLVNMWNRANDVVTDLEANGNAKLIQLQAIAVNTNPIF